MEGVGQGPLFITHEAGDGGPDGFLGRESLLQGGRPERGVQRSGGCGADKGLQKGLPRPEVQITKESESGHQKTTVATEGRLDRAGHRGGGLGSNRFGDAIQNVTQNLPIGAGSARVIEILQVLFGRTEAPRNP